MRTRLLILPLLLATAASTTRAQGTAPTFRVTLSAAAAGAAGGHAYVLAGTDPAKAKAVTIPTLLVPVALVFATRQTAAGAPFVLDAARVQDRLLRSPVFSDFSFTPSTRTQYMDAMLRATFPHTAKSWHTRLGRPEVEPVRINVPAGEGYVLTSKRQGGAVAVVDRDFVERAIFSQVPAEPGKLVIAVTLNTTYYALGDATVCCSWGTHGVDPATGDSFVLGSYLQNAPPVVHDRDVQPLTQQLAEYILNPGHNPLLAERAHDGGNIFPAWMRPMGPGGCGGTGAGSTYFMLEPKIGRAHV